MSMICAVMHIAHKFFLAIVSAPSGGATKHLSDLSLTSVDSINYACETSVSFATQVQMNLEAKIGNYLNMVEKTFVTSHILCEIPLIV